MIGDTLIGLHEHPATDADDTYSRVPYRARPHRVRLRRPGCSRTWENRLDDLGIAHGGIVDAHYGSGLSFNDPDGIALEFFAPPQ